MIPVHKPNAWFLGLLLLFLSSDLRAQTPLIDVYAMAGPGWSAGDSVNFGAVGAEFVGMRGFGLALEGGRFWAIGPYNHKSHSESNGTVGFHFVATLPAEMRHARVYPFFIAGPVLFDNPQ